jgi:hypothetical protein
MRISPATLLWLALATPAAEAARPFVTDDARVVDKGGCQVETFYKQQQRFHESEAWLLPACNPWGVELTLGGFRVDSRLSGESRTVVLQGKTLLKPLETNGSGFALTLGALRTSPPDARDFTSPYLNAIGSFSLANDRVVLHTNVGAVHDKGANLTRGTWGAGAEILLSAPRWYGIVESYGQRGEKPTLHTGLRIWLAPNRLQMDATVGAQNGSPERRFFSVGLRALW